MYVCKQCGNKKYFLEMNCVETEVNLEEETGEYLYGFVKFRECVEVLCGICKATSEDGDILDIEGNVLNLHI